MHSTLTSSHLRRSPLLFLGFVLFYASICSMAHAQHARHTRAFDANWRFIKGDFPAADQPGFDDGSWRELSLPHDWAIEGPFNPQNPTRGAGAFLPSGVGWYRKHFALPAADAHRRVFIQFDGVMANSDVWINGVLLGHRPYGYVSFRYEITGHIHFGKSADNVIAVRCDTSKQPASRWYEGAGIYRHVCLIVTSPVHIAQWATFISTPQVSKTQATVHVETAVRNQGFSAKMVRVEVKLYGPGGALAASASLPKKRIAAGQSLKFTRDLQIKDPDRWDISHPALYRAVVLVREGKHAVDDNSVSFGIRKFHFDAATGFWLNGRNLKIHGVCLHADGGAFGIAVPLAVWQRRLEALRALGVNAIRTAHNPVAPEFLALCDRMGFLVMDEFFDCWTVGKEPYDYHRYFRDWYKQDTRDTVRRDRNHPSIILYSAGNEIRDTPHAPLAHEILASLIAIYHANDPTRPVTQALFRPNASHDYQNGLADMLGVVGQNYRLNELLAAHADKPSRKIIGTEDGLDRASWLALRDHPALSGEFLWAGIDYLGESHQWPYIGRPVGLLDRDAFPHPQGLQWQSWWSSQPIVHILRRVAPSAPSPKDPGYEKKPQQPREVLFHDWTPENLQPHTEDVEVYSNCGKVELFLNGKSLGAQTIHTDAAPRTWSVPFSPGLIRAVGTNHGVTMATETLRTAGAPVRVELHTGRSKVTDSADDVAFVTATVTDKDGVMVPGASNLIHFTVHGPGEVAAVDNADNNVKGWADAGFHTNNCRAYQGRCVAYIEATGRRGAIRITAAADGLTSSTLTLDATKASADKAR